MAVSLESDQVANVFRMASRAVASAGFRPARRATTMEPGSLVHRLLEVVRDYRIVVLAETSDISR